MVIYVLSPFGEQKKYARQNERFCNWVINRGHLPLSTHHNFSYLNNEAGRQAMFDFSKEMLKVCDEIWVFIENGKSHTMSKLEIYARQAGKTIKHIGVI